MAIYLRVLPNGYREHFLWCQFKTAEKLAAIADCLWEMRGGNPVAVVAVGRSAFPGQQQSPHRQQQQQQQKLPRGLRWRLRPLGSLPHSWGTSTK
jgi:hypothetical protein